MKLALGTVQFGMPYGIANRGNKVSLEEARAIVEFAWSQGIDTLDTAVAYGESEQALGQIGVKNWKVITKLPAIPPGIVAVEDWVRASVKKSLERLQITALAGLLLHRPAELLGPQGRVLERALQGLKRDGLVQKMGISVYDPAELDRLIGRFEIELVQSPYNVLDRRLVTSGWLDRLSNQGVEVHARSIFLQGLLLFSAEARPRKFDAWASVWREWQEYLTVSQQSPLEACLLFVSSQPRIARMVVGTASRLQLAGILEAMKPRGMAAPESLRCSDRRLIDPSQWNSLVAPAGLA